MAAEVGEVTNSSSGARFINVKYVCAHLKRAEVECYRYAIRTRMLECNMVGNTVNPNPVQKKTSASSETSLSPALIWRQCSLCENRATRVDLSLV
jgi:hypothetical protein